MSNIKAYRTQLITWCQKWDTDLFEWKGHQHLIIVDYYSRYLEIAELRNTKAKTVINKTKSIFSRHGIPEEIVSDNGPQYSSDEYKHFATDYGFNQDPYLALLDYRNTPIDGVSPAQALMSRKLRSNIPVNPQHLNPKTINKSDFLTQRSNQQHNQKHYYDRTAKPLQSLKPGDAVRLQKKPNSNWVPATVISTHETPRSYIVRTPDGGEYRRNRRFLMKTQETVIPEPDIVCDDNSTEQPKAKAPTITLTETPPTPLQPAIQPAIRVNRYGRIIKPNPKYKD